jgi:ABC-type fe3+-siderophore transport system, permease component
VGAALGLAGALMQCLTRNPLADPGILGVNSGAALAVVLSVALFGLSGVNTYMWAAFIGAGAAAVAVYLLGATGRAGANPVRLALAGVAVSAALGALTQTVILADQDAFNEFRYWVAGSLEGRGVDIAMATTPLIALGAALGLVLSPSLNALALGEEAAKGLGVRVEATRTLTALAVTLLAGAATAAAGPISFVGLAVPVAARAVLGPDQRWVALASLLLGPVWVLGADVLARVIIAPQELQVGVVAALAGAPCFIAMVRTKKVAAL